MVFDQIFKGEINNDKGIFLNPGFRGLKFLPYPRHVKLMIHDLQHKVRKISPERKHPIYNGVEIIPNIDSKENATVVDEDGTSPKSPKRKTKKVKIVPPTGYYNIPSDHQHSKRDIF